MVDAAVGAAASAFADAAKASVDAAPAVGCVYAPEGYVVKADVVPVALHWGPAQPAPKTHAPPVHAGQLIESPKVVAKPPGAAHAAVVTRGHEAAPASDDEPAGHAVGALEPAGQNEPAGHTFVVPTACPATQKYVAGQTICVVDASVLAGQ